MSMEKTTFAGFNIIGPGNSYNYTNRNEDSHASEEALKTLATLDLSLYATQISASYSATKDQATGKWTEKVTKDGSDLVTKVSTPTADGWNIVTTLDTATLTVTYKKDAQGNWNATTDKTEVV